MSFVDALNALNQGRIVKRDAWVSEMLEVEESVIYVYSISDGRMLYVPSREDLLANDWRPLTGAFSGTGMQSQDPSVDCC